MPIQDFGLQEWTVAVTSAAGSITAVGYLSRKLYRTTREFFRLQAAASRIIASELTINGGGSMLDKINRIAPNHVTAEGHWTELDDRVAHVEQRLSAVENERVGEVERRLLAVEKQISGRQTG